MSLTTNSKAPLDLRQKALQYLARREYSAHELKQKLLQIAEAQSPNPAEAVEQQIDQLIIDFQQRNWLSDQRFTEQIVHARVAKFGVAKIAHELKQKGVAPALIHDALSDLQPQQLEQAKQVWQKKFKQQPEDRQTWAKQARFLQSRGYSVEIIRQVLSQHVGPDEPMQD